MDEDDREVETLQVLLVAESRVAGDEVIGIAGARRPRQEAFFRVLDWVADQLANGESEA